MTICPGIPDDSTLSETEKAWVDKLMSPEYGQEHLLEKCTDVEGLQRLIAQVDAANNVYPGGILNYITRARKFLKDSREGVNPFEGYIPKIPLGETLVTGTPNYVEMETLGLKEFDKIAFVLVAGGLGERLGYPGIKVALPIETITEMTYMEYYIRMILACEAYAETKTGKRPEIPFAIMTSEDTHEKTVAFLEEHKYFGFPKSRLTFMRQEKVPALIDNDARFAVGKEDQYFLETKPHGHGDVHILLNQHKLPRQWADEGREWVIFFQDTNGLVAHALAPLLGVSRKHSLIMNSLTVPRKAEEAMGAVCKLQKPNGESLTINVEYNQLAPLMIASGMEGDTPNPETGYSYFPGNVNILVYYLPRYAHILEKTGGVVPEFVNPKYADSSKTTFKSPTRLESLMQDLPRVFDSTDKVGSTQLDRWLCFSTVKNNVADAAVKATSGGVPDCAFTGESDFYYANAKLLELAAETKCTSVTIAQPTPQTYLGIPYQLGPKVVMFPSFGIALEQIKERLHGGTVCLAERATLVLDGNVSLHGFELDGAASLRCGSGRCLCVKALAIKNKGVHFDAVDDVSQCPAAVQIRGYHVKELEMTRLCAM